MDDRERKTFVSVGQQGRQLRENMEKAREQMNKTGSIRDKRLFEYAFRKWKAHAESWRKVIDQSVERKGARPWPSKDSAIKTESIVKKGAQG